MNCIQRAYWTARAVGWDNLPRRILQIVRQQSGWLKKKLAPKHFTDKTFQVETRLTTHAAGEYFRKHISPLFTIPDIKQSAAIPEEAQKHYLTTPCQKLFEGQYQHFSHWYAPSGWPPNFNRNALQGIDWPVGEHWMGFAQSSPSHGDIKLLWEPNRLTSAFLLRRQFALSGEKKWCEATFDLLNAWFEQNPAQLTGAWACGQESSFRLMAMIFSTAESNIRDELAYKITRYAWQLAKHLDADINYAQSQKNNHALSEAVGLWTIGILFNMLPKAKRWTQKGLAILTAEAKRQIYDDGSFVQHSLNYHRVMLDDLLWVISIARQKNLALPKPLLDRFNRATCWLAEFVDPVSGRVPNYGSNDGANILPLACCDYLDYRPVLQACWYAAKDTRFLKHGPWDEKLLWLFGEQAVKAPQETAWQRLPMSTLDEGGYYILRSDSSWAMVRCHTYRDRPAEPDMLHVDLWHEGKNILRDGGSYFYYTDDPVGKFFKSTAAQNTIQVDQVDQMIKGLRFLWFKWTRSRLKQWDQPVGSSTLQFIGTHYGYEHLGFPIVHERKLCVEQDTWGIRDQITSSQPAGRHLIVCRFRLIPGTWTRTENSTSIAFSFNQYTIQIEKQSGLTVELLEGQVLPPEGWESLYYGEKHPVPTLKISIEGELGPEPMIINTTVFTSSTRR